MNARDAIARTLGCDTIEYIQVMTIEALARSCKNMHSEAAAILHEAYNKFESTIFEKPHPVRGEILRALAETSFSSGNLGTTYYLYYVN
jgi:hypothetical protein